MNERTNERANERTNLIKVTLSQLTVAGALNKSYRSLVSVVSENENSHVRSSNDALNRSFEVVPKCVQR